MTVKASYTLVRVATDRYLVRSTRGATVHDYWVDPNALRCECAAGSRGRPCAHLRFVLDLLTDGARA